MFTNPFTQEPLHSIIIYSVKAPLVTVLNSVNFLLPDIKAENLRLKNSLILLGLRDNLLAHIKEDSRKMPIKGLFNLFIMVYDYDAPYTWAIDWIVGEFLKIAKDWLPNKETPDARFWI